MHRVRPHRRRAERSASPRRGSYVVLLALVLVVLLSFGAFAIDVAYMRLAQAQAQDVADAASQAAVICLRQSGDAAQAESAARRIVELNRIGGRVPDLTDITFGGWDDTLAEPFLDLDAGTTNAVRVRVAREEEHALPYLLGRLLGLDDFDVSATATSATRSLHIIFVTDITNSWSESNFLKARTAATTALEMLGEAPSGQDYVGMTIFTNRYAWEYTPLTRLADTPAYLDVLDDWALLNTASKAGRDSNHGDGRNCSLNGGAKINNFASPVAGGCYPHMPREYRDEPGTDHSTGMALARQMFEEASGATAYRAMIVLTDGQPNGLGSPGTARAADGYVEERWREYVGPAPRSTNDIRYASIDAAEELWEDLNVHTWVVSFVADDWMMDELPQGDGYYVQTRNADALEDIYRQIVSELPLAIVE